MSDGVLYVIDKLGRTLAQMEQEIAALRQQNETLEAERATRDQPPKQS